MCGLLLSTLVSALPSSQDFQQVQVGSTQPKTVTLSYPFPGLSANPNFSLAYGLDFAATPSCPAPTLCTLSVSFVPKYPGLRQDAIIVKDASGNLLATTLLHGIGLAPEISVHPGIITTFAPTVSLAAPQGLAMDSFGNLYIADSINEVVKEITPNGTAITVAGSNTAGYAGDGGPATSAKLNTPTGVALDGAGNLYIADKENNVIREVSAITRTIRTIAGNHGNTHGSSSVGDGGPAISATLYGPNDVAVDSTGNIYIADSFNGLVRKVDISGIITTVAGGGIGGLLSNPSGLALDPAGNLYIADTGHNMIRFLSSTTITAVAGNGSYGYSGDGGPALSAELASPYGIRLDAAGNIYIADFGNNVIREVQAGSGNISTVAGNGNFGYRGDNGSPHLAELSNPASVVLDSNGNLFTADSANTIRQVSFALQPFLFRTANVGEESAPQTQTVFNVGNQPLNFAGMNLNTSFFKQQASGFTDCSATSVVLPGSDCVIAIALVPTTTGSL
ncbi:MAG: SMP-30/gluconolactonase/LRE family protein, partial [Acidobacteriota bacterium]|nr:SMP-30/gluconolactonase/LRE family protein [Acidobacteriota bacterium]